MRCHGLVLAFSLGLAASAHAAEPTSLVVFGDSLVDAGNAFLATRNLPPEFQAARADLGYFRGRFQEGPSYTDILSDRLYGSFTTPFLAGGQNYAVGGARAAIPRVFQGVPTPVPSLPQQLGIYLGATGGAVDPTGLYVINFGNNDVGALQSGDTGGLTPQQYVETFVGNIAGSITTLNTLGARNFLVVGVPDPRDAEGMLLQSALNQGLDLLTPSLATGTNLYRFDAMAFFNRVRANPLEYGVDPNIGFDTPCIPTRLAGGLPVDCSGFFTFDGIHPVARIQQRLAQEIAFQFDIVAIPEPSAWALMITGFGLAGAGVRRRARHVPLA